MKHFLVLFLLLPLGLFAQTEQGTRLLGGNGMVLFNDPLSISLNPNVGVFAANNLALGAGIPLGLVRQDELNTLSYGLTPFLRYYLGKSSTRPFVQAQAGYAYTVTKHTYLDTEKRASSNYYYGGGVGLAFFITEQVAFETLLAYNSSEYKSDDITAADDRFSLKFGFQIHIPRK